MHEYPRYWDIPDMKNLYEKLDNIYIEERGIF
jgi:hypothetical protein